MTYYIELLLNSVSAAYIPARMQVVYFPHDQPWNNSWSQCPDSLLREKKKVEEKNLSEGQNAQE